MSAEDVNRILGGVIILIIGVAILNTMFASSELDSMAEQSASAVADSINEAALLQAVDHEPTLDEVDKYVPFMVRFGEPINFLNAKTIAFQGARPSYQIYYEKFPDASPLGWFTMWTESYPWSGGMMQQLIMYGAMRSVTFGLGSKTGKKITGKLSSYPVKFVRGAVAYPARLLAALESKQAVYGTKAIMKFIKWKAGKGAYRERVLTTTLDIYSKIFKKTTARKNQIIKSVENGIEAAIDAETKAKIWRDVMFPNSEELMNAKKKIIPPYKSIDDIRNMRAAVSVMDLETKTRFYQMVDKPPMSIPIPIYNNFEIGFHFKQYADAARGWGVWKSKGWTMVKWPFQKVSNVGKYVAKEFRSATGWTKHQGPTVAAKDAIPIFYDSAGNAVTIAKKAPGMTSQDYLKMIDVLKNDPAAMRKSDILFSVAEGGDIAISFPKGTAGAKHINLANYMDNELNSNFLKSDVTFARLSQLDPVTHGKILKKAARQGLSPEDASMIWEVARKNHPNDGGAALQKAGMKVYADKTFAVKWDGQGFSMKNPEMFLELQDVLTGRFETNPTVAMAGRRIQRAILFDYGKYKTPITGGAWVTQKAEEETTGKYDESTDNSIVFVKRGNIEAVMPLDEKVASYGVKISREKPSLTERFPVGIQTSLFRASIVSNPRYYIVSPCFGIGKAWKGIDNGEEKIFIKMSDENKMCSGAECKPGVEGCDPADCANYCYATNDRIWGKDGNYPAWGNLKLKPPGVMSTAISTAAGCLLATVGVGAHACAVAGAAVGYSELTYMMVDHGFDTSCTEKYWGYWNWYLASDTMDNLEIMATLGSGSVLKVTKGASLARQLKYGAKAAGKNMLTDISMIPLTLGDALLTWPSIGYNKYGINKEYIQKNQAECIWGTPDDEQARKNIYGTDTDLGSQIG